MWNPYAERRNFNEKYVEGGVERKVDFFLFQSEDGIRDAQESRGLGDVYKRQERRAAVGDGRVLCREIVGLVVFSDLVERIDAYLVVHRPDGRAGEDFDLDGGDVIARTGRCGACLLYTSDAADDLLCVYLGGRRTI